MSKMGQRLRTIGQNYKMAAEHDRRLGLYLALTFFGIMAIFVAIGVAVGNVLTLVLLGLPLATLAAAVLFSRRAMAAAYKNIEGMPGAAVAVIQNLAKSGWSVMPTVAINRQQDMVHRAIGPGGIVLIGEGTTPALSGLMATEKKRTARFVGEVPITEIRIGQGEGEVAVAQLNKYLRKMNKVLAPGDVRQLRQRLEALAATPPVPIPKGPIPKSSRSVPRGKQR